MKRNSDFVYWKFPWQKWLILGTALVMLLQTIQLTIHFHTVQSAQILTAAEREAYFHSVGIQCSASAICTFGFFAVFLIGTFSRNRRQADLAETLTSILTTAAIGVLLIAFRGAEHGWIWFIVWLFSLGVSIFRTIRFLRKKNTP